MNIVATIKETNRILDKYNLVTKKSLGQNFLVDASVIQKIIKQANITRETVVIEVGPGIGALTQFLCQVSKKVIAFDVDTRLQLALEETLKDFNNVEIIFQDFLTVNLEEITNDLSKSANEIIVVTNLPYYITTPIIEKVVTSDCHISKMIMMVQKEVAEKLVKPKTTKEITPLHILMETIGHISYSFTVSNHVFNPKPSVDSAVLEFIKNKNVELDSDAFYSFLNQCFKQRRKTLYNNLKVAYPNHDIKAILEKERIDLQIRSEALEKTKFLDIYRYFIMKR